MEHARLSSSFLLKPVSLKRSSPVIDLSPLPPSYTESKLTVEVCA